MSHIMNGTDLELDKRYEITAISDGDPNPTLKVGDVVECQHYKPGCVDPDDVDGTWLADYLGAGNGYGTIIAGLREVE